MKKKSYGIMGTVVCIALLGLLIIGCTTKSAQKDTAKPRPLLVSGHPEWKPIMYRQGEKIVGAGPEIVAKIFKEMGVDVEFKYEGPWDQVQTKARSGTVDVLVAAYKTPEREKYMDYSIAYTKDPVVLVVKKGKQFPFDKWDALVSKKGVVMTGDSYGQEFDKFIAEKASVTKVGAPDEAFALLENDTADYFVYALYSAEGYIFDKKVSDKVEIISPYVATEDFYLTISKKSPLAGRMAEVNALLKKYKDNGTVDAIIKKNKDSLWK